MSASTPPVAGESVNSGQDVEAAPEERLPATCWSSASDAASDRADLRSSLSLRERIEAASAAGFRGFGLLAADLPAAEQEYGLSGIRAMLDDNGMADSSFREFRTGGTTDRRTSRHCTTDCNSSRTPDRAPRVSLSTRGILSVRLPRSRSSHPFHCIALSESSSMMQTHRLAGTLFEDTVHRRRYGGDGVFDLTGMIKALHTAGRAGPWGVEIPSVEHRFLPVDEVLSRAAISARRALERAR
jgi:hypothetical protein